MSKLITLSKDICYDDLYTPGYLERRTEFSGAALFETCLNRLNIEEKLRIEGVRVTIGK